MFEAPFVQYTGLAVDWIAGGGPFLYRMRRDGVVEYRKIILDNAGGQAVCCTPFFDGLNQQPGPGWLEIVEVQP